MCVGKMKYRKAWPSKWQGWLTIVGGVVVISIGIAFLWCIDRPWSASDILLLLGAEAILTGVIFCIVGIRDLLSKRGQG